MKLCVIVAGARNILGYLHAQALWWQPRHSEGTEFAEIHCRPHVRSRTPQLTVCHDPSLHSHLYPPHPASTHITPLYPGTFSGPGWPSSQTPCLPLALLGPLSILLCTWLLLQPLFSTLTTPSRASSLLLPLDNNSQIPTAPLNLYLPTISLPWDRHMSTLSSPITWQGLRNFDKGQVQSRNVLLCFNPSTSAGEPFFIPCWPS